MNRLIQLAIMISALVRGRPRMNDRFIELLEHAQEWAANRQDALMRVYDIGSYEHFQWDQERGVITFSNAGVPKVVANIQFVGSTSTLTKTWLWAWQNSHFLRPVTMDSLYVRHVGTVEGFERLTRAKWHANEDDGWQMTAVQARLAWAEGMYRTPGETGWTFMTLSGVRWATPDDVLEPVP